MSGRLLACSWARESARSPYGARRVAARRPAAAPRTSPLARDASPIHRKSLVLRPMWMLAWTPLLASAFMIATVQRPGRIFQVIVRDPSPLAEACQMRWSVGALAGVRPGCVTVVVAARA